jgi:alpha-ketoglutarate-dependent taurine dioxygenase
VGGVAVTKTAASTLADEVTFEIPRQAGDLALVDNYIAMHGRRTFSGTRKTLTSFVAAS